jgi:hypothetical protein
LIDNVLSFNFGAKNCGAEWRYLLMPTPHDATNTLQRWRVDSASHRVADPPIFNPRTTDAEHPTFALDHVPAVVGILDRVKGLLPNV